MRKTFLPFNITNYLTTFYMDKKTAIFVMVKFRRPNHVFHSLLRRHERLFGNGTWMILTGEIWLETWHLESMNELEDYKQQTRFSRIQLHVKS